jgi:hypothetical protein
VTRWIYRLPANQTLLEAIVALEPGLGFDAFPWDEAPRHLVRDRDGAFGPAYVGRIRAMRIRDHPTAPHSPCQNGLVERLIGSIRCESLDHLDCARRGAVWVAARFKSGDLACHGKALNQQLSSVEFGDR